MIIRDLGLLDYDAAFALQLETQAAVAAGAEETLLLVEHPPVVTCGRHGGRESLRLPEAELQRQGVAVVASSRGGNATCHFPGQLVGYPICRLACRPGGVRGFVTALEDLLLAVLAEFGLRGQREDARPGVWLGGRKVASIGLAVHHLTTCHGFALNVAADLGLFAAITPCGLAGVEPTSLSRELGRPVSMEEVKHVVVRLFGERFTPAALAEAATAARGPGR